MSATGKVENVMICSGASAFARKWCYRRGCSVVSRGLTATVLPLLKLNEPSPNRTVPNRTYGGFMGFAMASFTYLASQSLESLPLSNGNPCCEFFQGGPEREETDGVVCQVQD